MMYVITHKLYDKIKHDSTYKPILVGASDKSIMWDGLSDDKGINISRKNSSFCELTGLYWIWKNTNDKYVGICHYRRYFCRNPLFRKRSVITQADIERCLTNYDVVVPGKVWFLGRSSRNQYKRYHNIDDWTKMTDIIRKKYPDYEQDIEWFEMEKSGYCYNMFIADRDLFDKYCTWLFDVLFELEKNVNTEGYGIYNRRIYGFLSERMLNIWIHHNKLRTRELPVYNTELIGMYYSKAKNYIIRRIKKIDNY